MKSGTEHDVSSLLKQAAAKRLRLAAKWPTAEQVGLAMGIEQKEASRVATQHRLKGNLLGVYMVEPVHHWRFPSWQFNDEHQPIARFAEILAILREHGTYLCDRGRTTGWGEVEWFMSLHVLLDGRAPLEVLSEDPNAVFEAARVEYIEDSSAGGF